MTAPTIPPKQPNPYRPSTGGGATYGGQVPPQQRGQYRAVPKEMQRAIQQRPVMASSSRSQQPSMQEPIRYQEPRVLQRSAAANAGAVSKETALTAKVNNAMEMLRRDCQEELRGKTNAEERLAQGKEKRKKMQIDVKVHQTKNTEITEQTAKIKIEIHKMHELNKDTKTKVSEKRRRYRCRFSFLVRISLTQSHCF